MTGAVLIVLAVLFLALSAIVIVYVLGIGSKTSTVRNAARRFHHAVGNPLQMRSAGTPGTYASVIRHQGRTTGRIYQTPVWAVPIEDGAARRGQPPGCRPTPPSGSTQLMVDFLQPIRG